MKSIVFQHIEFLLPKSGCVIIPEFGAFIVNIEAAKYDLRGFIIPPKYTIVFNQDLKHNDGTLTSSIQKVENISFDKAAKIIKDSVTEIRHKLSIEGKYMCGKIGYLEIDELKNISFYYNQTITHPKLFGLDYVSLNKIPKEQEKTTRLDYQPKRKYIWAGIAAVAVSILLFTMPTPHIENENVNKIIQQADFINSLTSSLNIENKVEYSNSEEKKEIDLNTSSISIEKSPTTSNEVKIEEEKTVIETVKPLSSRTYYIIVGSDKSKAKAEKLLYKFKSEGFSDAEIVHSGNNYRIYIASFDYKQEAEVFLDVFRIEKPEYKTAWLFSKKNK